MAKKTPPRTDFDLGDLIAAGYHQNRQQESASDEPLVGPQTQRIMDGMPAKERGVTGALKDTAVQLAEGANSVLGAIPSLVAPHSRAANFFEKNADYWREAQSDDIKSRTQAASAAIDAADEDGVIAQVVEAARQYSSDPALAARFVVTNLPSLIPGIGAAKVAQAASLAKSARAAGVATKALGIGAKAKAAAAATTAGGLVNAGLNAGGARGDAFTEVKQAAIESGMSEAEAEDLALSKSVMPAVVGGIAGFVSGKTGIERSLFGAGTKKSAAKAATASIVSEMGGEQLEELAPKLATNLQAGEIDGRSLSKDVGRTMVETAIGAGPSSLMAGGVEAIKAAQERKQAAVTSAQASGGIASRAGLAANGHATVPPAAPTQAPVAPVAQTDPSAPVILAQQEIAAMRSAPELDEAETRRLQFLEENLGDPKTLAELYGMEYNPPPDPAAPPAQPDQATPPEAPATPAGVSASGEPSAGPQVDPTTGEILGAPVEDEPASAGEPPQAPMFDEQGQVVPEHDPLAGRTDEDLKTQRLNALSGRVKRTINDELKRRSESAPPEPESGELDVSDTAPWRRNIGKAKKLADQLGINHKGMKLPALTEAIERASGARKADVAGDITGGKIDSDWSSFSEQSGTLGIPRSEMPQIKAEHRGAMVNFLKGKGIEATPETIPSRAIKPTQAEFSPEKVKSAMDFTGGDRAIIVSADGHVVDGHHQWLAKREKGEPIKALRLDTNIRDVLDALKSMPSAQPEQAKNAESSSREADWLAKTQEQANAALAEIGKRTTSGEITQDEAKREYRERIGVMLAENAGNLVGEAFAAATPKMLENARLAIKHGGAEGAASAIFGSAGIQSGLYPQQNEAIQAEVLKRLDEAKPKTDLATTGESKQFTSYAKWINDGKIVSPGMREQIAADERLEEGESDRLLALTDKRDGRDVAETEQDETLNLPKAIKDLAEALRSGGWDAFTELRSDLSARYNLDVRQTLDLGTMTAAEVGPLFDLEHARAYPFKAGRVAHSNGEMPIAPDGLTHDQKAEWLDGWDDGASREPDSNGPKPAGEVVGEASEVVDAPALPVTSKTEEESNGTEAAETVKAEAQGQEEPAPADAVSAAPEIDTSPDARWRKNWAAARDTAESLGLPTKDGKRSLKLTELVPAIEAKLKDGANDRAADNKAQIIEDAIGKQIEKAKRSAMRLRAQAKASDLNLEQKLEKQAGVKKAEETLRRVRQNVFAAQDAAMEAVSGKDASKFSEYKKLFPDVYAELVQFFGEPAQVEAPAEPAILDATNMTPMAVHDALMNGAKLSRHGETVWVGRKTTGTVDSYVVHSKEDDGSTVFTKGPVGASRDIGWSRGEAAEKAIASWDFDTIPVLEAQVAEQDAMLDSVLERLAQQGQVTDGRLEQRRIDLEAMLDKTREQISAKKALEASSAGAEQQDSLESIFAGLQADGEAKSQAEQKAAASQFASRIEQVEANFHDALIALMEAGTLKVNGQSAITEDNRACL